MEIEQLEWDPGDLPLYAMKSLITIDKYQNRVASFFRLSWIGSYYNKRENCRDLLKRQESNWTLKVC